MNKTWREKTIYILKKLLQMVIVLVLLSTIVFVIARLCPGDPLKAYYGDGAEHMSQVQREAAREKLGLDDSMPVQYARWAAHLFDGDLGLSYKYKQPVTEVIGKVWVNTLILGGVSYVLTFGLAILLGLFCALREDSLLDRIICKVGVISGSVPSFFLALLLILVFAVNLKLLPVSGAYSYGSGGSFLTGHIIWFCRQPSWFWSTSGITPTWSETSCRRRRGKTMSCSARRKAFPAGRFSAATALGTSCRPCWSSWRFQCPTSWAAPMWWKPCFPIRDWEPSALKQPCIRTTTC